MIKLPGGFVECNAPREIAVAALLLWLNSLLLKKAHTTHFSFVGAAAWTESFAWQFSSLLKKGSEFLW